MIKIILSIDRINNHFIHMKIEREKVFIKCTSKECVAVFRTSKSESSIIEVKCFFICYLVEDFVNFNAISL